MPEDVRPQQKPRGFRPRGFVKQSRLDQFAVARTRKNLLLLAETVNCLRV